MVITVVLDRNLKFFPAHIEMSDQLAELIGHRDLRLKRRQAGLNQDNSQPRLLRRLRPTVE